MSTLTKFCVLYEMVINVFRNNKEIKECLCMKRRMPQEVYVGMTTCDRKPLMAGPSFFTSKTRPKTNLFCDTFEDCHH